MIDLHIVEHTLFAATALYALKLHREALVTRKQHDYYVSVDAENERLRKENAALKQELDALRR